MQGYEVFFQSNLRPASKSSNPASTIAFNILNSRNFKAYIETQASQV